MNEKQIKWLMILATLSTIALVAIAVGNVTSAILWLHEQSPTKSFKDQCEALADSGQYVELETLTSERLKEFPKDPTALWYLAIAAYGQDDLPRAKDLIKTINERTPWWESSIRRMQQMIESREKSQSTEAVPKE